MGFAFWLVKVWNIARNTGASLIFYSSSETRHYLKEIHARHPVEGEFKEFTDWNDFLILSGDIETDDNLFIVMSRKDKLSYNSHMPKVSEYLNKYFTRNSFILVFPRQSGVADTAGIDLTNPSLLEPIEKLDEIGKTIASLFRKK